MVTVTGRKNEPMDFVLSIPKKITRRYHGTLEIKPTAGVLIAVVTTDREAAVASVVAAESIPDTPAEALKAQAIATRSYFVAGGKRHHDFDFCDTTHCQFLREPTPAAGAAARVVAATRGFVLAYDSQLFSAMYTRRCSGTTRTPAELGLPSAAYPYCSVECKYCLSHPARWSSRIPIHDGVSLRNSDESARLNGDIISDEVPSQALTS
jgi:SpoIID/LytB domain protein